MMMMHAEPTAFERLAHVLPGTQDAALKAERARRDLAAVDAAVADTPCSGYGSTECAMAPRTDCRGLVALGLTWPEERQRLRHALENVVHAVKGDAGRHLQRLQRYLAHLEAKTLSEEDAAAMFDALQAAPEADAATGRAFVSPIVARTDELRAVVQLQRRASSVPLEAAATAEALLPQPKPGRVDTATATTPVVSRAFAVAAFCAGGTFAFALVIFMELLHLAAGSSVSLSAAAGGTVGTVVYIVFTPRGGAVAVAVPVAVDSNHDGAIHTAAKNRAALDAAVAALALSIAALARCPGLGCDEAEMTRRCSGGADACAVRLTDPSHVTEALTRDGMELEGIIAALTAAASA